MKSLTSLLTAIGLLLLLTVAAIGRAADSPSTFCDPALAELASQTKSSLPRREFDGPLGESAEGSSIQAYYRTDASVAFLDIVFYGETGRREVSYALLDTQTFDYTVTDILYRQPLGADRTVEIASSNTREYRVCDGELTPLAPSAGADQQAQDARYARRIDEWLGLIKRP